MTHRTQYISAVVLASSISVGIVSSLLLLLPTIREGLAQGAQGQNMGIMNGSSNNNMSMMTNSKLGMNSGWMNANMTMDQMLDMMDMMHNMMMNMMRMMVHSDTMKGGNMTSNMNTMNGMQ